VKIRTIEIPINGQDYPQPVCGLRPSIDGLSTVVSLPSADGEGTRVIVVPEEDATAEELLDRWRAAAAPLDGQTHRREYRRLARVMQRPGSALRALGVQPFPAEKDATSAALVVIAKITGCRIGDLHED